MTAHNIHTHFAQEYGGTKAFACHTFHLLSYYLGGFRKMRRQDLTSFSRVIFVCKGNICRSPYAAIKARELGINAISAGIDTSTGKCANDRALIVAAKRGVDLSQHKTTRLAEIECSRQDLIIVMEPSQLQPSIEIAAISKIQATLIGIYSDPIRPFLQDPYGRDEAYFNRCYEIIDSAIPTLKRQELLFSSQHG